MEVDRPVRGRWDGRAESSVEEIARRSVRSARKRRSIGGLAGDGGADSLLLVHGDVPFDALKRCLLAWSRERRTFSSSTRSRSSRESGKTRGSGFACEDRAATAPKVSARSRPVRLRKVAQYSVVRQGTSSGSRVIISRLCRTPGRCSAQRRMMRGRSRSLPRGELLRGETRPHRGAHPCP